MKVEYRDDPQKGAGYGEFVFSEAMMPDGPWEISIQRGTDHSFLTGKKRDQWVGEAIFIPLEGKAAEDGSLSLRIGPEIVNSLNQMEQYQTKLKGASGSPLAGRLRIGAISYSPSESLDNTAKIADAGKEKPEEKPKAAPAASPRDADVDAILASLDEKPAAEGKKAGAPEGKAGPDNLEMPAAAKPQKKLWRYLLLALLAIACIVWFLVAPPDLLKRGSGPESGGEGQKTAQPSAQQSAEERVGGFFAGSRVSPEAALELSRQLPKNTPADQDAVYRLYYYAAANDVPAAYIDYAACVDPSRPQWGTIEKDAPLAWQMYEKAKKGDKAAAEAAQKHLLDWLEKEAKAGNARARDWLSAMGK